MMPRRVHSQLTFGGRVPWGVGLVLAITIVMSLVVAFGDRHAGSLFEAMALVPEAVWRGQIWRLVTWVFVEPSALGLIFGCLFVYWFGGDLAREWGSRRFLAVYGGIAFVSAIATCLIARVDEGLLVHPYLGGWATGVALMVAWGLWFPERVIRIWFVLPIRGYVLAWVTVALTFVFAIYSGWERYVPELCAELTTLGWLFRRSLVSRWSTVRGSWEARRREAARRDRVKKRAKSVAYLRVVESHDDNPPPLPPDVDAKLDDLLRGRAKRDRRHDN